jgi:hypothetical protein
MPSIFMFATVWDNDLCTNSSKLIHYITAQEPRATENSGCKTSDRASSSFTNRNLQASSLLKKVSTSCDEIGVSFDI